MPRRPVQNWTEKYLLNPGMRFWVRRGLAPRCYVLIETTGRRSGLIRTTPVAGTLDGDTYWLVAVHGADSGYVRNLTADARVRVLTRRRWRDGTATACPPTTRPRGGPGSTGATASRAGWTAGGSAPSPRPR